MKKLIYLFALSIGAVGCSVDSLDSEQLTVADLKLNTQEIEKSMSLKSAEICEGEAPVFVFNFPQNTTGNSIKDTDIQIQAYNPVSGEWEQIKKLSYEDAGPKEFTFTDSVLAVGTYQFRANIGSGGFDYQATLTVIKCSTCENSLVADLVCGEVNNLTVTFTAEEAGPIVIQGGLTNGTLITSAESNVLVRNTSHNGVQNSNASVTRWEGNVEACEEVTIEIAFSGGNGIGDWTAKRGEDLLGSTENQVCVLD